MKNLLEKGFGKKLESFSNDGIRSIESYLMGISGLAISSGLLGRVAMNDHHKVYYQRHALCSIPNVSDNLPLEFLLTAAQFYPTTNENWIEETHLGYIKEMTGAISSHEIEGLKYKLQRVRDAVNKSPVEKLLQGSSLKTSAMTKLQSLYKKTREEVGLMPLPDKSSCSIM